VPDWPPAVDIAETPEEFLIKADLPEVKKEDVKVTVENGVLLIEGERRQEKEENTKKFHRIERAYGSFVRMFMVPDAIDEAKVSAVFKDGLLNVDTDRKACSSTRRRRLAEVTADKKLTAEVPALPEITTWFMDGKPVGVGA
jgi:HSP20 family protein